MLGSPSFGNSHFRKLQKASEGLLWFVEKCGEQFSLV